MSNPPQDEARASLHVANPGGGTLGSLDPALILSRGVVARLRAGPYVPAALGSVDGATPAPLAKDEQPASWTRDRALAVLLPIAEGGANDSAKVAAVAELNRMHGLHGPTLAELVQAAQRDTAPNPTDEARR